MSENTAVVKAEKNPVDAIIEKSKAEWARVLPKICTPERFARMALSCIRKNEKLAAALNTPTGKASVLAALMTCAELGIEPDGRRAHLIPYGDEITLIIDYKGVAELVMRSGNVSKIHADVICENDEFEYDKGEIIKHKINFRQPRGEAYAAYSYIRFKDGSEKSEVMGRDDIYLVREKSKGYQAFKSKKIKTCPWTDEQSEPEMWKKTVFKRCSKWAPLSPEVRDLIEKDDEDYIDIQATAVPEKPRRSFLEKPPVEKVIPENAGQGQEPEKQPTPTQTKGTFEPSLADVLNGKPVTAAQIEAYYKKTGKLGMTMSLENNKTLVAAVCSNPDKVCSDCMDWMSKEGVK